MMGAGAVGSAASADMDEDSIRRANNLGNRLSL